MSSMVKQWKTFKIKLMENMYAMKKTTWSGHCNQATIHKSKVKLTLNKPTYVGIWILDLIKVLIFKFHYDYIKNKYDSNSRLWFFDTRSLMYETKTENVYEDFNKDKEILISAIILSKNIMVIQANHLLVKWKMKQGVSLLKNSLDWRQNMYLFLIDDTNEQKKAKGVNKNGAARIDHGEYKNVLLNKKCLRYSINRIKLNIKLKIIE